MALYEQSADVAQMDAVDRLGVAIKRIALLEAEIERLRAELKEFTELKEYAKSLGQETYLELHAKNERLRAALKWYADQNNYRAKITDPVTSSGQHRNPPVVKDFGAIARNAISNEQ